MEITKLTKRRVQEYLKEGKRFDGRKLLDYRKIEIETGVIKNAEGSARVKLGDTEVLIGVKLDVVEPFPDQEEEGVLITTAELLPLSAARYEPGPPKFEAIELARIIDRGIRECGFIDFKKLCIKKKEKVWCILLDMYSINDNGGLIDACAMGAVAALKTAKLPKYDEKKERTEYGELTNARLPLTNKMPLILTFHKVGKYILVDPIVEEEEGSEARVSLALTNDKELKINAIQKGGEQALSEEEIFTIIDNSVDLFERYFPNFEAKIEKDLKSK